NLDVFKPRLLISDDLCDRTGSNQLIPALPHDFFQPCRHPLSLWPPLPARGICLHRWRESALVKDSAAPLAPDPVHNLAPVTGFETRRRLALLYPYRAARINSWRSGKSRISMYDESARQCAALPRLFLSPPVAQAKVV